MKTNLNLRSSNRGTSSRSIFSCISRLRLNAYDDIPKIPGLLDNRAKAWKPRTCVNEQTKEGLSIMSGESVQINTVNRTGKSTSDLVKSHLLDARSDRHDELCLVAEFRKLIHKIDCLIIRIEKQNEVSKRLEDMYIPLEQGRVLSRQKTAVPLPC